MSWSYQRLLRIWDRLENCVFFHVCVCSCICICAYVFVGVFVCQCLCLCVMCVHVCTCARVCVCICVFAYVCVFNFICVCVIWPRTSKIKCWYRINNLHAEIVCTQAEMTRTRENSTMPSLAVQFLMRYSQISFDPMISSPCLHIQRTHNAHTHTTAHTHTYVHTRSHTFTHQHTRSAQRL